MSAPQAGRSSTSAVDMRTLPPLLRRFEVWTVIFFLISCAYHSFFYFVLHRHGHSVNPFTLDPRDRFGDFTIFNEKYKAFHTEAFFSIFPPGNYPATVAVIFEFFFNVAAPHSVFWFVTLLTLSFLVPFTLFGRKLIGLGIRPARVILFVTVLCLLSWPNDLIFDGGNAEWLVWFSLAVAMWAYATGRSWLAAAMFGIAASLKLFPVIFLALFLSRRHFPKLLFGIAIFLVASVASFAILGPTISIAYHGIVAGIVDFSKNYMAFWRHENYVDHSLFASIKLFLLLAFHHPKGDFSGWLRGYTIATVVGGSLLYLLVIRKLPILNQVLVLSISSIYFTAFSGDGTLVHLYYPLAMLFLLAIQAWRDRVSIPGLSTVLSCMVFCLSMESFLAFQTRSQDIRFIGPAHCIALTIMLITALRRPFGPPLAAGDDPTVLAHPVTTWARSL